MEGEHENRLKDGGSRATCQKRRNSRCRSSLKPPEKANQSPECLTGVASLTQAHNTARRDLLPPPYTLLPLESDEEREEMERNGVNQWLSHGALPPVAFSAHARTHSTVGAVLMLLAFSELDVYQEGEGYRR